MRRFRLEKEDGSQIIVTLYQAPFENENILNKCGPSWKEKSVKITEIKQYREME